MLSIRGLAYASVSLMSLSAPAFAQNANPDAEVNGDEDIVVTGTLIRNTQATGSQTVTVDQKTITEVASTSTNELLTTIPQLASFNGRPEGDPRGLTAVSSIVRPNLRNFPSTNATSGALTLIMVDGVRLTPVGSNASSPDPDIIPAAVLQGIDIVTDGGSSLYGADAVAGVMNFRTMRKFDGVKLDGNFGFGSTIKGYHTWDASVTAGKSWDTGNFYVSVGRAERDLILNRETSWANGIVYNAANTPRVSSTTCNAPQATVTNWYRFGTGATQFTNNPAAPGAGPAALGTGCDQVLDGTYLPGLKRTNVFASLTNEFSDSIDLRVTGYWLKREISLATYPLGFTSAGSGIGSAAALTAAYPAALAISPGTLFAVPEGTGFALGPNANYVNKPQLIGIETWGITPELTVKLGNNWQVRTSMHYGQSTNPTRYPGLNTTLLTSYISGGQVVPGNIAAASATVINDITNWETAQDTKHKMYLARVIADGSLFALPSGDVKIAVGAEYQHNKDSTRISTSTIGSIDALPYNSFSRNVKSIFAELHVPVLSFVDLAGSVRHDRYSDFGNTTNPNIGLTVNPTSWLKLFGHWGTSYNAPTAYDKLGIGLGRAGINYVVGAPVGSAQRPTVATGKTDNQQGNYFVVLTGASPKGLKPQTAKSWALGFEAKISSEITFGGEYYSIDLKNAIGSLNPSNASTYLTNPTLYLYNNELNANGGALFNSLFGPGGEVLNGAAIISQTGGAANVAIVVDTRSSNLNAAKVEGIDFHLNYSHDTSWGNLSAGIAGSLATKALITNGGAVTNELGHGQPRLTAATFVGMTMGGLSAKATFNYSGQFRDGAFNSGGVSQAVSPFMVTNLAFGYNFKDSDGPLQGTSLRLNIDNVFGTEPHLIKRPNTNNPSFNHWTLGRVIKLGLSQKF